MNYLDKLNTNHSTQLKLNAMIDVFEDSAKANSKIKKIILRLFSFQDSRDLDLIDKIERFTAKQFLNVIDRDKLDKKWDIAKSKEKMNFKTDDIDLRGALDG